MSLLAQEMAQLRDAYWVPLGHALRGVRAFASHELTEGEAIEVERLIALIDQLVERR